MTPKIQKTFFISAILLQDQIPPRFLALLFKKTLHAVYKAPYCFFLTHSYLPGDIRDKREVPLAELR